MQQNPNLLDDLLNEQLSGILDADDATLEVMLASGQIDAITDGLYTQRTIREQVNQFRTDGMSKEDVWEQLEDYQHSIGDLLAMLSEAEGQDSARVRVIDKLLSPGADFLREVHRKFAEGDCLLKVELMEGAKIPTRAHEADAGMDIYASDGHTLLPGETYAIGTGLKVAIPHGWQLSVRPRSGLSRQGIVVANSPGTVDSNYHAEVAVLLTNTTNSEYTINAGDRIAQFVLEKVYAAQWEQVDNLEEHIEQSRTNESGEQGFGSTGR